MKTEILCLISGVFKIKYTGKCFLLHSTYNNGINGFDMILYKCLSSVIFQIIFTYLFYRKFVACKKYNRFRRTAKKYVRQTTTSVITYFVTIITPKPIAVLHVVYDSVK